MVGGAGIGGFGSLEGGRKLPLLHGWAHHITILPPPRFETLSPSSRPQNPKGTEDTRTRCRKEREGAAIAHFMTLCIFEMGF